MLIVILVILSLSLLILGHEAGHFFVAKYFKLKIDEFGFGFPPRLWSRKKGEVEYSLNALPFGGFVKIAGENDRIGGEMEKLRSLPEKEKARIFLFQPAWRRALIVAAGVTVNFIIGWILVSLVLMIGTPGVVIVTDIEPDSPAAQAGVMPNDIFRDFSSSGEFLKFINANRGKPTDFKVLRNSKELDLTITPREENNASKGALGVYFTEGGEEKLGFFSAIWNGLKRSALIFTLVFRVFYELVRGMVFEGRLLEGVVGPVGIFSVAQETSGISMIYFVYMLGVISLNLSAINLIPFPALDGGRIMMILVEKIKGSPLSIKAESLANGMGFVLLIVLMALITVRDVANLF
ncbi:MAG: M50 family metallopeptidase [Patescibacteria group bacterium]